MDSLWLTLGNDNSSNMDIKQKLKTLFLFYQRGMWYTNQAKGEYAKIGSFIPETLMIMTYLTVKGIEVKGWYVPLAYLLLMVIAAGLGKFFVLIGVTRYNNSLSNDHNAEIMGIREDIGKIKDKLGIK